MCKKNRSLGHNPMMDMSDEGASYDFIPDLYRSGHGESADKSQPTKSTEEPVQKERQLTTDEPPKSTGLPETESLVKNTDEPDTEEPPKSGPVTDTGQCEKSKKIVSYYIEQGIADAIRKLATQSDQSYSAVATCAFLEHLARNELRN